MFHCHSAPPFEHPQRENTCSPIDVHALYALCVLSNKKMFTIQQIGIVERNGAREYTEPSFVRILERAGGNIFIDDIAIARLDCKIFARG